MIETTKGKIEGVDRGTYIEFRGIPYAKPPVGILRWKPPVEKEPWSGVYQAKKFREKCVQTEGMGFYKKEFYSASEYERPMSEDCLYLNIWMPKNYEKKKLPVAFWIHGGGFLGGYSSEVEFDGRAYCERGVILVTIAYRCGIFGFFAHPWLNKESEKNISGNYGILDQVAALKWVYENIEAFGGDKNNITVFGQSAGAMSVQALVSSELTGNMIAKAIMQSGGSYKSGLHNDITLERQMKYGIWFTEIMEADNLRDLRSRSQTEILSASMKLMEKAAPLEKGFFLAPTLDGYVLKDTCYHLMERGQVKEIPYLLGTTKNDILVTPELLKNGEFSPLYKGCIAFSQKLEELGRKAAYVYYFTRNLPGDGAGAFHSSELWYMFGTLDRCWRPMEKFDYQLSKQMLDYWANFMKTGNPNEEGAELWKCCTKEKPAVFEIG